MPVPGVSRGIGETSGWAGKPAARRLKHFDGLGRRGDCRDRCRRFRPPVRQRPHTGAEEQLNGVLGDGSGDADAPFQVFAEVRGGDYLGHHRWVVFHSGEPRAAQEGRNLASGGRHLVCAPDPERRVSVSSSSAPEKAQLHDVPICWACDLPI
jgi:hypothetical protein